VEDQTTPSHGARDGCGVAEIARYGFDFQLANAARRANQRSYPMPALYQEPGYVPA
jgi:hypothetical protein